MTLNKRLSIDGDTIVERKQCPKCEDSTEDALAVYADGHEWCYKCNSKPTEKPKLTPKWLKGTQKALKDRAITELTCAYLGIEEATYTGNISQVYYEDAPVRVFNWYDEYGNIVNQKIKTKDKDMKFIAKGRPGLYGKWKFSPNPNTFITITEGEEDAAAILQAQNYQYPVVSLPNGAGSARRALEEDLKYLLGFKYVALAYDQDEAGQKAVEASVPLFEPGKVRVACWPPGIKDANELLIEGRTSELTSILFKAKEIRPKALVTISDIIDDICTPPQFGVDFPWKRLTEYTYGALKHGEIYVWIGATGVGKTEIIKDITSRLLESTGVGVFSFEQSPADTMRRYVGSRLKLKLQKPGSEFPIEDIRKIAEEYEEKIFLYDSYGMVDTQDLLYSIRYLAKAKNFRMFIIDPIKSLGITLDKKILNKFMNDIKALVRELKIDIHLVAHLNKDTIKQSTHVGFSSKVDNPHAGLTDDSVKAIMNKFHLDWENGRVPSTSNIEGGNDIAALADYVLAISRNMVSDNDYERRTTCIKVIKCGRTDSEHAGKTIKLYRNDDGQLEELL